MEARRIRQHAIVAGGVGVLVGAALAAGADDSSRDVWDRSTTGALALSLLLAGLAAWHFQAWGLGKLIAIGVLAASGLVVHLADFGDGTPVWSQGWTGVELVARWLVIASAAVVLIGVLWSFVELTRSPRSRSEDVAASVSWWRKWWILVVGIAVGLWVLGLIFSETDSAPPADTAGPAGSDESGGDDRGPVVDEEWTIALNEQSGGVYTLVMIKTFSPLDEADIEDLGGRLVWEQTEIELCRIGIRSVGDGFVQVGDIFQSSQGCDGDTGMQQAFDEFGPPITACVYARVGGVDDEYCAPLTAGTAETEPES
jgi:hypothetical protein